MDKVIVKFEKEIKYCSQCPFACKVYEHGYSAVECSKLGSYKTISEDGIRKDCPFRK